MIKTIITLTLCLVSFVGVTQSTNVTYFFENMHDQDQKYRHILMGLSDSTPQYRIDSLWDLQRTLDIINTNDLEVFIYNHGYPQQKDLYTWTLPYLVLWHSPIPLQDHTIDIIIEETAKAQGTFRVDWLLKILDRNYYIREGKQIFGTYFPYIDGERTRAPRMSEEEINNWFKRMNDNNIQVPKR